MGMTKKLIAIDIDDVLADTTEALRLHVNERYNVDLQPEYYLIDGEYRGYYERVWEQHGLHEEGIFDSFRDRLIKQDVEVKPIPSAQFGIGELLKKFNIIFVTARSSKWEEATRGWFNTYFKDKDIKLYFSNGISLSDQNAKTKGEICKELGASYLIDDNTEHCQSAIDQGIGAILFGNFGWQRHLPNGAVKCEDWPAVLEYFDGR
jgi:5'(3')-deoxyribonucleotidase